MKKRVRSHLPIKEKNVFLIHYLEIPHNAACVGRAVMEKFKQFKQLEHEKSQLLVLTNSDHIIFFYLVCKQQVSSVDTSTSNDSFECL